MNVKGDDFMRNVEIEKEKIRLQEQRDLLSSQKTQSVSSASTNNAVYNNNEYSLNNTTDELNDIILDNGGVNNKQKYIILGLALVLLFLITIVTIRLLTESETKNDFISNNQNIDNIQKDIKVNDTSNTEEDLDIDKIQKMEETILSEVKEKEKIIDKKDNLFDLPRADKQEAIVTQKTIEDKKPIVKENTKVIKKPTNIIVNKEKVKEINLADLFKNIDNKEKKVNDKPKVTPKKIIPKKVATTTKTGYFVQVGAFTQTFNAKLKNALLKNNYSYILHKVVINGKNFTKVLVGPYTTREIADAKINNIRQVSNNSKAYVLRLK